MVHAPRSVPRIAPLSTASLINCGMSTSRATSRRLLPGFQGLTFENMFDRQTPLRGRRRLRASDLTIYAEFLFSAFKIFVPFADNLPLRFLRIPL